MMRLFKGYHDAYGVCNLTGGQREDGKENYQAATKRMPLTIKHWEDHLNGKQGLGIIPIDENDQVNFAVIDIDLYNIDPRKVIDEVNKHEFPLVPMRSKSGGLHLVMFFKEPMNADEVVPKLRDIASFIGYGDSEIFPKQTKVLLDRGDLGIWINMPYFDSGQTMRYGYTEYGKALTIEKFIKVATNKIVDAETFRAIKLEDSRGSKLDGGPPCLNLLINRGFPAGTRNKGLFNLGVYAFKSNPDDWEKDLETYNNQYMKPPLPAGEVLGVVKSLKRKEYNYTCKEDPINSHCNSSKCRACKFGVGTGAGLPAMGSLSKLCTDPPIWFLEIDSGGRLELSTDDLQNPLKFQKCCMDTLNIMPTIIKREVWHSIVQDLIKNVNILPVPMDVLPQGQLIEHLEKFCGTRMISESREALLTGKPYKEKDRIFFRMQDFLAYLDRIKFKEITSSNKICSTLRKHNCKHAQFNINRRCVQVWSVPDFAKNEGKYEAPLQDEGENY